MVDLDKVVLLHDGDIFAYRASAATDGRQYVIEYPLGCVKEKYKKEADLRAAELGGTVHLQYFPEPESHALHIVQNLMKQVPIDLAKEISPQPWSTVTRETYLTGGGSFREKMNPIYKENRKDLRRPEHLKACKEFMKKKYGAECHYGLLEADDMLAIRMTFFQERGFNPICISIDKDLKQVEGWHWDFIKKELLYIDKLTGLRNFYKQLLTGDTTDGIIGIKGIGPKGAEKLIDHLTSPFDMYVACLKEWLKALPQVPDEDPMVYLQRVVAHVNMNAQMLYLLRHHKEHWEEPDEEKLGSIITLQGL